MILSVLTSLIQFLHLTSLSTVTQTVSPPPPSRRGPSTKLTSLSLPAWRYCGAQDWFTECARVVASVRGESVEWVTPLGLPVVQPYVRSGHKSAVRPLSETGRMNRPHFSHEAYE